MQQEWTAERLKLKSAANASQQIRRFHQVPDRELPGEARAWKLSRNVTGSGLKNWLFIANAEAGPASALLCTLVANCREQKIDPERYFVSARPGPSTVLRDPRDGAA